MIVEQRELSLELQGQPFVIVVEKGDVCAFEHTDAGVTGMRRSARGIDH